MDTHASFNEKDESIECCESNITLIVDKIIYGKGTLYVADSKLYWKNYAYDQVISINYDTMSTFDIYNHRRVYEKPCLVIYLYFNNIPDVDKVHQNEDKNKKLKCIILVPDRQKCLKKIYEAIKYVQPLYYRYYINYEDKKEGSNLTDISLKESDEHEDTKKNSHITISSTCTREDQKAGSSIDVSNQYHQLDAKNGEKKNQDKEVLINERKRKIEDLPEQEENPTKIRKLWNLMKHPFQKITSRNTSISENEPNISIDEGIAEVIARKKNSFEPETAVCENNSDSVKAKEKNSQNNSEADGKNEDTSINETSQNFCKIM